MKKNRNAFRPDTYAEVDEHMRKNRSGLGLKLS
jgi:hypothetical protein